MSEATDFHPRPAPLAVPRRARAASPRRAERREPAVDPRLEAALSLDDPEYPLDPPLVDVRIPVKAPHAIATKYSCYALMRRFPGAEVGDDLHILFTEPGKSEQTRLSPDVFVALEVPRRKTRGDYDVDALGPPDFVLEVVSRSTWRTDVERKLDCYQQIGVRECLFFDATGEDRAGQGELWGCALTPERSEPLGEVALPNGERGLRSEVLGLVAYVSERVPPAGPRETWALTMRWHDPATGNDLPDHDQVHDRADAERDRADAERDRADAAEHEALAQRDRADAAAHEVLAQRDRADAERDRADAAEREMEAALRQVAALEERLGRGDGS